jgi:CheY-like chemotaxis protein
MDGLDSLKKPTILAVDDEPGSLALISSLLKNEYRVKIAISGEKALRIAASDPPPDLILLDIMMPGMDGYEVCRRLKRDPTTMHIPVLFLTARAQEEDEEKGLELGAIDYIIKPISPLAVLARVKNHLVLKATSDCVRDQNEWDTVEQFAASLKGTSGKVSSVSALQQLAEKLGIAIKERRFNKLSDDLKGDIKTRPDNRVAHSELEPPEEQGKAALKIDLGKLRTVCDKLEALLVDDDAKARDVLDENAFLLSSSFPNHFRTIDDNICAFNFEAALATLRAASATYA